MVIEKFRVLLKKIEDQEGKVLLFVIMKMDDLTDKWSIVISANWVKDNKEDYFEKIVNLIKTIFTSDEISTIARLGLYKENDYMTNLFTKYKSEQQIINEQINGFKVHEAYIFKSEVNSKVKTTLKKKIKKD